MMNTPGSRPTVNWFTKHLLVQNTPGNQDFPVINTLAESLLPVFFCHQKFIFKTCSDACSIST
jgi:uncharacterized membrane protein YhdT